jgi:thiamine-phosphate pyrophosphorylase
MAPFPRLYPIVVPSRTGSGTLAEIIEFTREVEAGGARIVQLREKQASSKEILRIARELRRVLRPDVKLILNDRVDLALAAAAEGVHLGQEDLPPEDARRIIGASKIVGVSTHNPKQLSEADRTSADYLAIGPIFATTSKDSPDPVVGLDGLRVARELARKQLVAIGGITLENCRQVIEAGADSVAVITELLRDPAKTTAQFLLQMR